MSLTPNEQFAIDPHPFRDADGTWYLYYARDVLTAARVGTQIAVDILPTMTALGGKAQTVLEASADWQLYQASGRCTGRPTTGTRWRAPPSATTTAPTTASTPAGPG